jgi:hypothetical protein
MLRLIEPGKPNQNAYVESFNSRLQDECLNEHWFTSLEDGRAVIEAWRCEYNEERPKKSPGGLPPAEYTNLLFCLEVSGSRLQGQRVWIQQSPNPESQCSCSDPRDPGRLLHQDGDSLHQ